MPSLPFHFGVEQVLPRLRQLLLLHEPGVVGLHEDIEARAHPFAVRTNRGRNQVGMVRALDELKDLLAVHRLQLGTVGLDDVHGETAGAALLHGAIEDGLGPGAPDAGLDPVFLLERLDDGAEVVRLGGGVDGELAFLLRALDELLQSVGPFVERHIGGRPDGLCLPATGEAAARQQP